MAREYSSSLFHLDPFVPSIAYALVIAQGCFLSMDAPAFLQCIEEDVEDDEPCITYL